MCRSGSVGEGGQVGTTLLSCSCVIPRRPQALSTDAGFVGFFTLQRTELYKERLSVADKGANLQVNFLLEGRVLQLWGSWRLGWLMR